MYWLLFAGLLVVGDACAEMDADAYRAQGTLSDTTERQRVREAIEAERQAEAKREAERRSQAQQKRQQLEMELARRPYPQRLMEMRCGACHAADALTHIGHTWPGWFLTISRMRFLNGAAINHPEAMVLTTHLAKEQPASRVGALLEYALVLLLPLTLGAAWFGWRAWRGRQP